MPWYDSIPWWLIPLLGGLLMQADYQLTLIAARPAQQAGLLYELNPFLRRDVALQRRFSPRFMLGTCLLIVALLAVHSLADSETEIAVYHALVGGIIATRSHLIVMHLRNIWRGHTAHVPKSVPNAMLQVATQQTLCAALCTLLMRIPGLPAFHYPLMGAAVGFLLMAVVTLLWRQRELRLAHATAHLGDTTVMPHQAGRSL